MSPENPEGNKEYKLKLSDDTTEKIEKLTSQMRYRMQEGGGEAIYTIGVTDSGEMIGIDPEEFEKTKSILTNMASKNNFSINFISEQKTIDGKYLYECHVREKNTGKYVDLRVACAGNVDTGKCEAIDTRILMANGTESKIQDIVIGDTITGDYGTRKVLKTTKGHGLLFKIEHENGEPLIINKNHILCLTYKSEVGEKFYIDIPFDEYIKLPEKTIDILNFYVRTTEDEWQDSKITSITIAGTGDYYGFELDGNGRYLHADGTVTHNSSLLGVLLTGKSDDGRGSARMNVFNYKHEVKSGKTSSVAQHILGFTDSGEPVHYLDSFGYQKTWPEIVSQSSKIVTFFDLCGHERYLKTTIFGLTSQYPDIAFVLVGGNMGLTKMTKEHIFLCLSLGIPFAIVVTKIDICKGRENVLEDTVKDVKKIITAPGIRKIPYDIKTQDDVDICAKNMHTGATVPIFYVSNVTRDGIPWIYRLLNLYTKKSKTSIEPTNKIEIHVDQTFTVSGIGTVVGGQLVQGSVKVGDKLLIGPENGSYNTIQVRSIHCKRVPVEEVDAGRYVCLGVRKPDSLTIRRGHVALSLYDIPYQVSEFEAEVTVVKTHSTTIKVGYEPIVHCGSIRQTGRILEIRNKQCARGAESMSNVLRTGDRAILRFRFCYKPEFVKKGSRILLAEGGVKIIGKISSIAQERLSIV